ncbi:uncharacterized protein B0H64DRAFT_472972 [Chaetomium fimeti]|uniref:Uncharacterized protein n=1 Tax=Chaetomium fimeti TaxID=1854472 RepID=A0AAE0HIA6_9PEZI|nr:hypothetical protein B0H64DRAFT_472972 [Chaetomium fimeti]
MNFATTPSSIITDPLQYPQTATPPSAARPQPPQQIQQQQQQQQPQQQLPKQPPPPQQQQAPQPGQQQQQQQQQHLAMNGVNGGNMPGPGMVPFPAPAGHQAELNYIYGMVEELSRQLADNQRTLEEVVSGVGRVRSRARTHSLGNDELVDSAGDEVKAQEPNLDTLISILSEALEKAKFSRDANAALLTQYATVISAMLKQFHDYKAKHVGDVAAWHRSYRAQLAEARAENCRLREQIWEMQARAGHANEALRGFRGRYDEDGARWDRRVDAKAVRQELRFWKRMAMPHLPEDDPYWSDDDDLVDAVEKKRDLAEKRQLEITRLVAREQLAEGAAGQGDGAEDGEVPPEVPSAPGAGQGMVMGGVPMQREDSGAVMLPTPPPRPSSAASSTGSSGQ